MTDMRLVEQTPWTDEERVQLRRLAENGLSRAEIGAMMGRTKSSVHSQMRYLHIARGPRAPKLKSPRTHAKAPVVHRTPTTTLPALPSLMDDMQ